MNTIKFIVVVSMVLLASDLLYHQVVNGQNSTQNNASKTVDKLIEDTKRDQAIDRA
jgi:cell division protein FtsI/penicillin-binding protein 2